MSDRKGDRGLSATLFGRARRGILALLYAHVGEGFYLRQIARAAHLAVGPAQRELKALSDAGIVLRTRRGRNVFFEANPECPIFRELRSLIIKTAGVADVLRAALAPLADQITVAFVHGPFAQGRETLESRVDIAVIGDVTSAEVKAALSSAQSALRREIRPTVCTPAESRSKVASRDRVMSAAIGEPKVFVLGNEHELARVAGKRRAGQAEGR